jgi:hypothetical protein
MDGKYIWLRCWSDEIVAIRQELGLPPYRFDGCSHITIGNFK